jgi:hypothetical protein
MATISGATSAGVDADQRDNSAPSAILPRQILPTKPVSKSNIAALVIATIRQQQQDTLSHDGSASIPLRMMDMAKLLLLFDDDDDDIEMAIRLAMLAREYALDDSSSDDESRSDEDMDDILSFSSIFDDSDESVSSLSYDEQEKPVVLSD